MASPHGHLRRITSAAALVLVPLMLLPASPAFGQYDRGQQGQYRSQYRHDDNRRVPDNYYSGVRDGGRGGNYDRGSRDHYSNSDDDRYRHQGGIGPGKGAAIGAGAGAVLGALFGGGLKGAVIGGAAGAGVGAIAGQANQNSRDRREYRDEY